MHKHAAPRMADRQPIGIEPRCESRILASVTIERLTWSFVALGVALRIARYLMNYPLWWDEAFVSANFLRRDYLDLLRPLDYGQVCPLLFVWAELSVVKLLGFSEWTLRLFPLLCGVASVFLFRHVAGRVLSGVSHLLAVAIFAVAYHPIRHAADVKPYSSDLLVALVLLALVLEWWRSPNRTAWLWGLAAFAPIAVGLSYPAVFVAGGLALAIAGPIWHSSRTSARLAWSTFGTLTVATFACLFLLVTKGQADDTLPGMRHDWAGSFPPIQNPLALVPWFVRIHVGPMLAYPCGGAYGASTFTLLVSVVALVILWRAKRRTVVACLLAPLGVALVAAGMKRYPYGGSARFMLYVAPSICMLAGLGTAAAWSRIPRPGSRLRTFLAGVIVLAGIGIGPVAADLTHPYRSPHADRARRFAQQFWPTLSRDGEPACLLWDFGIGRWNTIHLDIAVYLCNQKIYSPLRHEGIGPRWNQVTATHPLRCVLAESPDVNADDVQSWLEHMKTDYQLRERRSLVVDMAHASRPERYTVFEFVPRKDRHAPPEHEESVAWRDGAASRR